MTLVLAGARIPGRDAPVDVVLDGARIAAVSPAGHSAVGIAERIPLEGRWLIPGLWDQHVHFTQWAQTARRLDVSRAASAADAAALVAQRAAAEPGDDLIVGFGFHDALGPTSRPASCWMRRTPVPWC